MRGNQICTTPSADSADLTSAQSLAMLLKVDIRGITKFQIRDSHTYQKLELFQTFENQIATKISQIWLWNPFRGKRNFLLLTPAEKKARGLRTSVSVSPNLWPSKIFCVCVEKNNQPLVYLGLPVTSFEIVKLIYEIASNIALTCHNCLLTTTVEESS